MPARTRLRRLLLALALVSACKAASAPPGTTESPVRTDPATSSAAGSTPATAATATSPDPSRRWGERTPTRQVFEDLQLIVGGNFAPDHIGPEAHAEVVARYEADPDIYLEAIFSTFVRGETDLVRHADLFIASFLGRLQPLAPERVADLAGRLRRSYDSILAGPSDIDARRRKRLSEQRDALVVLEGGIDRPLPEGAPEAKVDRVCATATPRGHGLKLELDCTCGETLACRAEVHEGAIEIDARLDTSRAPMCTDCYPTWTTCSIPQLDPKARVSVRVGGTAMGDFEATDGGWLPVGTCVPRR